MTLSLNDPSNTLVMVSVFWEMACLLITFQTLTWDSFTVDYAENRNKTLLSMNLCKSDFQSLFENTFSPKKIEGSIIATVHKRQQRN